MRIDFFAPTIPSITGWRPESDGVTKNERIAGPVVTVAMAVAVAVTVAVTVAAAVSDPEGAPRRQALAKASSSMLARMPIALDGTKPVRKGEELDVAALARFLDVPAESIEVTQFPGGHSNLTYLLRLPDRELVLRRPPFGNTVKTAHDMGREVRMLTRLRPHYDKAPRVVANTEDPSILGAPFYVMERVRGVVIRRNVPAGLELTPALARSLSELVVDGLVELHAIDVAKSGLLDLGKPEGFVERQVRGWSERYAAARTDDIPDMPALASWLAANMPASEPATIVHNDWKLDNLVLAEDLGTIVGVLDWEMSTIGDPLIDLGTTLSYWVESGDDDLLKGIAFGPTMADGTLTRREVVARYAENRAATSRASSSITSSRSSRPRWSRSRSTRATRRASRRTTASPRSSGASAPSPRRRSAPSSAARSEPRMADSGVVCDARWMRWCLVLVALAACGDDSSTAADGSTDAAVDDAAAPDAADAYVPMEIVHKIGRFDTTDPNGPRFAFPGSAVGTTFDGTGVSVSLVEAGENYFDVIVDDGAPTTLHTTSAQTSYPLAQGLAAGTHTVWIVRRTESLQGVDQFKGFTAENGSLVSSPIPHTHRIEMIGDSITCGYGDLGAGPSCGFSADTEDEDLAWGAVAAKALGARHTAIAYSGRGVYRNADGSTTGVMPEIWMRTFADDPNSTWDFTRNVPDVVVVNLGTNDFALGDPGSAFTNAYASFLGQVRTAYPNAYIVCVVGPMLAGSELTAAETDIQSAIATTGDAKTSFLELPTQSAPYGCGYHPTTATQAAMAAALVTQIQQVTGW